MSDWAKKASNLFATHEVVSRVEHLRRLMLIHSCIYYEMDDNIVDDHRWQQWADELVTMQMMHGHEFGFYDAEFRDWSGATGCHLPLRDPDIVRVARRLLSAERLARPLDLFAA